MKQTKEKRRVAIINDAILQLKAGSYRTGLGGYVKLPKFLKDLQEKNPEEQAQKHLKDISSKKYCGVCAKGSLFLSLIRKENECKVGGLEDSFETMRKSLTRDGLFAEYNINLLEAYYEQWTFKAYNSIGSGWVLCSDANGYCFNSDAGVGPSQEAVQKMADKHNEARKKWSANYPNATERLLAILANMKKNKGIFKPLTEKM